MNKFFCLALLSLASPFAQGQSTAPDSTTDKPTAPYVARAPEFFTWAIDITQKKEAAPVPTPIPVEGGKSLAPPPPAKILKTSVVTKTGQIIRDVRTFTDGSKTQNWWIDGRIFRQNPETGVVNITVPGIDRSAPQFNVSDFEFLSWIDLPNFSNSEKRRGVDCFVYEWKGRMPAAADFEKITDYRAKIEFYHKFLGKPTTPTRAWIDKNTRLPVAAEDENATYTYRYLDAPTEVLSLPPDFQKLWDRYKETLDDWKKHVMPKQR